MGGGAGGLRGLWPLSFCQIFAKSPFFASNFSISMPTAPSRSSQPPHFQIHSAVYVHIMGLKECCAFLETKCRDEVKHAMTKGHCCIQLASTIIPPLQWVQGRNLVGFQGAKPPEAHKNLHWKV